MGATMHAWVSTGDLGEVASPHYGGVAGRRCRGRPARRRCGSGGTGSRLLCSSPAAPAIPPSLLRSGLILCRMRSGDVSRSRSCSSCRCRTRHSRSWFDLTHLARPALDPRIRDRFLRGRFFPFGGVWRGGRSSPDEKLFEEGGVAGIGFEDGHGDVAYERHETDPKTAELVCCQKPVTRISSFAQTREEGCSPRRLLKSMRCCRDIGSLRRREAC